MHLLGDLVKPGLVAALVSAGLTVGHVDPAFAARSGGRVGGRAPVSRPTSTGRPASPAASIPQRSTTNVYVAPSMGMGYGGYGYGGYGYGGGGSGLGLYMGLSFAESLLREQQRQAYLQQQLKTAQELGQDKAAIADLQRQLAAQDQRMVELQNSKNQQAPSPMPPASAATQEQEMMMQMRQQMLDQQKQIMELKQAQLAK